MPGTRLATFAGATPSRFFSRSRALPASPVPARRCQASWLWRAFGGGMEISESRAADPAVVFENGLTAHKEEWNKAFPEVARTNTVFAYNRPGIGESPATARPRDGATIVEDLRALLASRNIQPPYVLVGHSAGGLYMQLYARRYPAEVAGLVLVEFDPSRAIRGRRRHGKPLHACQCDHGDWAFGLVQGRV